MSVMFLPSARLYLILFILIRASLSLVHGCASSIPAKYQTVIISNEEKKGFSSQARRFEEYLVSLIHNLTPQHSFVSAHML